MLGLDQSLAGVGTVMNIIYVWQCTHLFLSCLTTVSLSGINPLRIIIIIIIIIIIHIILIILGISFMQGIYTYIPETNHVPREHCVATILM